MYAYTTMHYLAVAVICLSTDSMLMHSKTAAPTELRRVTIEETTVHLLRRGSNFSTEFRLEEPSLPPIA